MRNYYFAFIGEAHCPESGRHMSISLFVAAVLFLRPAITGDACLLFQSPSLPSHWEHIDFGLVLHAPGHHGCRPWFFRTSFDSLPPVIERRAEIGETRNKAARLHELVILLGGMRKTEETDRCEKKGEKVKGCAM